MTLCFSRRKVCASTEVKEAKRQYTYQEIQGSLLTVATGGEAAGLGGRSLAECAQSPGLISSSAHKEARKRGERGAEEGGEPMLPEFLIMEDRFQPSVGIALRSA
jgi:hypothetical protein